MSLRRRLARPLILLLAAFLLAVAPACGYIVFLKDGSQIQTKEKPRIEGDKAILILPSGTQAFYDANEIDVEKTEKVNVINYGTAKILEGLDRVDKEPEVRPEDLEPTFGEVIAGRNLALPPVRRRQQEARVDENALPVTRAGFIDLMKVDRDPYPDSDITAEVLGYLKGQGVDRVRIFRGTEADRPLLEIVSPSEASVFKALKDAAGGLVQIHDRFPDKVAAFELLMITETQLKAGQFVLTPELADLLVTEKLTVPNFFLRFVEF